MTGPKMPKVEASFFVTTQVGRLKTVRKNWNTGNNLVF